MSEETPELVAWEAAQSRAKERAAFNTIADAVEPLSREARLRLFRLLTTHFDIPFGDGPVRNAPSQTDSLLPSSTLGSASFTEDRTLSPKQFMLEKRPLTDIERIACLAYYLAHYRDSPHFKTLDSLVHGF